ncbi:MAG TPA: multidrug efflux SMR transporter [Candidatus Stackebrandtia faecavium]|nr:multidrug efflux SMR transporter [Candidatus Stackebrandtia faecavium]
MSWLWLLFSITSEVTATVSLRAASTTTQRWWWAPVVLGYLSAFAFLAKTLEAGMPVGIAYGIWTSVGIVVVALLGRAIWKDPLNRRMAAGIGLVVAGVALVELGA